MQATAVATYQLVITGELILSNVEQNQSIAINRLERCFSHIAFVNCVHCYLLLKINLQVVTTQQQRACTVWCVCVCVCVASVDTYK